MCVIEVCIHVSNGMGSEMAPPPYIIWQGKVHGSPCHTNTDHDGMWETHK